MAKAKISIVKYLNAVPLAWGILEGSQKELFDAVLSTPAECADQLAQSDAALLIGDNALKFMEANEQPNIENQKSLVRLGSEPLQVFDLAERWRFLTGLPFVFAFWAVREGFKDGAVVDDLKRSRDFGVANIPTIADKYSESLQIK